VSNYALGWINHVDRAGVTFTTDSALASLPAANLADPVVGKPWRTAGATAAYVEIDLGAALEVGVLALAGLDQTGTDTIRARLSAVAPGDGELLDTTAQAGDVAAGYRIWTYVPAAPVAARYLRFDLAAASLAAQGYFDVGRAWAGPALRGTRNYALAAESGWRDPSVAVTAPRSGVRYVDSLPKRRWWRFRLPALTAAETATEVAELQRVAGLAGQVLWVPRPGGPYERREALLGRAIQLGPLNHALPSWWESEIEIEEDL